MEFTPIETNDTEKVQDLIRFANTYQDLIVEGWRQSVVRSIQLPISEAKLLHFLKDFYASFLQILSNESEMEAVQFFTDFVNSLSETGLSLSDVIEILLLLQPSINNCNYAQIQPNLQIEKRLLSDFSAWLVHFAAGRLAAYMDQTSAELKKQRDMTATLLRVSQTANSSLELDKVFRVISQEIVRALDAQDFNSLLFPDRSKYGHYFLLTPFTDYEVPDPPENFGLDALIRKEPVTCYDAALDPRTDKRTVEKFGLKSLMAFPFIVQGKAIASGLIVMKDYHHFTQEEIDLVMAIANSGAMAIENARLHEISLQYAVAEERNRLAQEMHDDLAQALAVIKIDINSLLRQEMCETAQETLQDMKSLVDETYIDLRDTIFGLRAINESDTRFLDNFKNYLNTFGVHSNLEIQISVQEEDIKVLSGEALLQVGRILEEALTNVRKHANAQHVWINGGKDDQKVWMTVEDDGAGIDPDILEKTDQSHFGLQVMAERAEGVGGSVHISNRPEGGTCVRLGIPYP